MKRRKKSYLLIEVITGMALLSIVLPSLLFYPWKVLQTEARSIESLAAQRVFRSSLLEMMGHPQLEEGVEYLLESKEGFKRKALCRFKSYSKKKEKKIFITFTLEKQSTHRQEFAFFIESPKKNPL